MGRQSAIGKKRRGEREDLGSKMVPGLHPATKSEVSMMSQVEIICVLTGDRWTVVHLEITLDELKKILVLLLSNTIAAVSRQRIVFFFAVLFNIV